MWQHIARVDNGNLTMWHEVAKVNIERVVLVCEYLLTTILLHGINLLYDL